ncbi:MAG: hypothetical protein U0V73_16015 [Acidimicrobiia bacterium]
MSTSAERVERFKSEVAGMGIRDPALARDRMLLRIGVAGMIIGVLVTIGAYVADRGISSSSATAGLEQGDYQIMAVIGLAVAVVGAALFLRYSIAQFLRFWLARLIYEQQAATDRTVEALARAVEPKDAPTA